jgi:hypothetical protein
VKLVCVAAATLTFRGLTVGILWFAALLKVEALFDSGISWGRWDSLCFAALEVVAGVMVLSRWREVLVLNCIVGVCALAMILEVTGMVSSQSCGCVGRLAALRWFKDSMIVALAFCSCVTMFVERLSESSAEYR